MKLALAPHSGIDLKGISAMFFLVATWEDVNPFLHISKLNNFLSVSDRIQRQCCWPRTARFVHQQRGQRRHLRKCQRRKCAKNFSQARKVHPSLKANLLQAIQMSDPQSFRPSSFSTKQDTRKKKNMPCICELPSCFTYTNGFS